VMEMRPGVMVQRVKTVIFRQKADLEVVLVVCGARKCKGNWRVGLGE